MHTKVFESLGWVLRRSEKSHYVLTNDKVPNVYISIPDHDEVDRRLLHDEIRKAGLNDTIGSNPRIAVESRGTLSCVVLGKSFAAVTGTWSALELCAYDLLDDHIRG